MIHPKVAASTQGATFGGALATLVVFFLNRYAHADIDGVTASAFGTVVSGVLCFISGFMQPSTPPKAP